VHENFEDGLYVAIRVSEQQLTVDAFGVGSICHNEKIRVSEQ
jgi:hypothetical protein